MENFSWAMPYASRRMPIFAENIVATSQPLAAQAGLRMLQDGGNAVDAALATAITLTVVEPVMNGIGSDAFCILWDGQQLHGLNASGRSPAAWTPARFAGLQEMPQRGWEAITVPGCVSRPGWHCPSVLVVYPSKNYLNPQSATLSLGSKLVLFRQKCGKNPSKFLASLRNFVESSCPREEPSKRENAFKTRIKPRH